MSLPYLDPAENCVIYRTDRHVGLQIESSPANGWDLLGSFLHKAD